MKYVTMKLEFVPDSFAEKMLFKNCEYRHWLYNKGVEYVLKTRDVEGRYTVSKYSLLKYLRSEYEFSKENRPFYIEEYDYYFRGICSKVVDDIMTVVSLSIRNRCDGYSSELRFIRFDHNNQSFGFENKIDRSAGLSKKGLYPGYRMILTEDPYKIGLKINKCYSKKGFTMGIQLKENIKELMERKCWNINDIREFRIRFHNEKWFLHIVIQFRDFVIVKDSRNFLAGIDLGETNPVTIYDGDWRDIPNELKFPKEDIVKVEKRIENLQSILDKKEKGSNNYYKVLAKFHKAWEHLVNIKKDWHFKLAYWIVTHYKNIVVDEFSGHIVREDRDIPSKKRKTINHGMYRKSMSKFIKTLRHMAEKYQCHYHVSYENTTNICSECGNVNKNHLSINERVFICEKCGYQSDRDTNASKNCYNQYELLKVGENTST